VSEERTPRWRSIRDLPIVASILDSMLHDDEGHYRTLLECRPKPYVLDDVTVDRVIRVFTQQKGDLPLYGEQLAQWAKGNLTGSQRQELERLNGVLIKVLEVADAVLVLAKELKQGTIDRVLSKSDAELGLEFLMGKWKL
jgi:hypothetical protein